MKNKPFNYRREVRHWQKKANLFYEKTPQIRPTSKLPQQTVIRSERDGILEILNSFVDNIAYLGSRRSEESFLIVKSEADVQDLLFVMLKPIFPKLTFENPGLKSAASYAIKDLYFPSSKTVLETKYIEKKKDIKRIEKELHDDIMKYSGNQDCEYIIFFIYDPHNYISDRVSFIRKMSQEKHEFMRDGRSIGFRTVIKPR